jgi:hypothetical protein
VALMEIDSTDALAVITMECMEECQEEITQAQILQIVQNFL